MCFYCTFDILQFPLEAPAEKPKAEEKPPTEERDLLDFGQDDKKDDNKTDKSDSDTKKDPPG